MEQQKRQHYTRALVGLITLGLLGVNTITATASEPGSDFGPAELAPVINDPVAGDGCPIEAPDGLSLAIASTRGPGGDLDIWTSDRASTQDDWTAPEQLPAPINSDANDFCPTPIGRNLLFVSTRPAACTGGNLYIARQGLSGAWSEPMLLPCAPKGPNFNDMVFSPSVVTAKDATYLFYSSFGERGDHDIYVSTMGQDGQFGPGRIVHALSNAVDDDRMPNIRQMDNGMWEVVFSSNRATWGVHDLPAFGGQDVYRSVSPRLPFIWRRPENLGANINTDADETRSSLSGDGRRLYFGRSGDVYVSHRD